MMSGRSGITNCSTTLFIRKKRHGHAGQVMCRNPGNPLYPGESPRITFVLLLLYRVFSPVHADVTISGADVSVCVTAGNGVRTNVIESQFITALALFESLLLYCFLFRCDLPRNEVLLANINPGKCGERSWDPKKSRGLELDVFLAIVDDT